MSNPAVSTVFVVLCFILPCLEVVPLALEYAEQQFAAITVLALLAIMYANFGVLLQRTINITVVKEKGIL